VVTSHPLVQGGKFVANFANRGFVNDVVKWGQIFVLHLCQGGDEIVHPSGGGKPYQGRTSHQLKSSYGLVENLFVHEGDFICKYGFGARSLRRLNTKVSIE
jgi:hypothetical protein